MNKIFFALLFILLIFSGQISGQKFYLNHGFVDRGTVSSCNGKFYDSNPNDNYSPNENYSVTFCSGASDKIIQVNLTTINIAAHDTLFAFDGNSVNAPAIDTFTNCFQNAVSFTPSIFNTTGCITFKFVSNAVDEKAGWEGEIKCILPCKQKISGIASSSAKDPEGYATVCFGDQAAFSVATQYPNNNLSYHQSDSTSIFHWLFGDGRDTTGKNLVSVKHLYNRPGGYHARLIITDSNGCTSNQPIRIPVKTSLKPVFNITPASICLFDTVAIRPSATINGQGTVTTPNGSFVTLPVSGDSVFLPDEPPLCFSSSITIEQFAPNQTLQNLNDLEGIFMNIEHSYLGDLTIAIEAPNGAKVFLKTTVEGSANDGTFLGEPVDETLWGDPQEDNLVKIRGKGYSYSFSNTPEHGTMWDEVSKYLYTYVDNAGRTVTDHFYLPAGSYKSEESMLPLIGTPLNGKWTLEVCDKQAIDNGFLFNWNIEFKKSVYPNAETYTIAPVTQTWLPAAGLVSSQTTTGLMSPPTAGTFAYTYHVNDAFGCSYDTTIKLVVNPIPAKPNLGGDTVICTGGNLVLHVANFETSNSYKWNTTQKGVQNVTINEPGSYWVEVSNSKGCKNRDTITIRHTDPFTVNLGTDTLLCANKPIILAPKASTNITSWRWSTGATTPTDTASTTGKYWVEAKDPTGCMVRDTIEVSNNPVTFFEMPGDTTICQGSGYTLALRPTAGTRIVWNDGSTGYTHFIDKTGTYSITADYKGCIHQTAMKVSVLPLPVFQLGKDTTMCNGYPLPLKISYPGATYRWSAGGTDSVFIAIRSGTYWAEATVNGCSYRDTLTMFQKLCACDIKMPNAFSPNGDGINDVYSPTIKCFPRDYHLSIFNRDGQIVFDTKNYQDLWDGKFHGTPLPVATYYFILTLFNQDLMENEKKSGSITLLR